MLSNCLLRFLLSFVYFFSPLGDKKGEDDVGEMLEMYNTCIHDTDDSYNNDSNGDKFNSQNIENAGYLYHKGLLYQAVEMLRKTFLDNKEVLLNNDFKDFFPSSA